ncbi:hypothetical protein [Acetivibrio cellulolyticus]|uniref:hypothetical protein n=1 Tax=Acetivibrio cellulolyticus TaxID=35830 RepID=UPI0001E301BC|nr:hypothetical protein [Acetivibrio cellulolyticus]
MRYLLRKRSIFSATIILSCFFMYSASAVAGKGQLVIKEPVTVKIYQEPRAQNYKFIRDVDGKINLTAVRYFPWHTSRAYLEGATLWFYETGDSGIKDFIEDYSLSDEGMLVEEQTVPAATVTDGKHIGIIKILNVEMSNEKYIAHRAYVDIEGISLPGVYSGYLNDGTKIYVTVHDHFAIAAVFIFIGLMLAVILSNLAPYSIKFIAFSSIKRLQDEYLQKYKILQAIFKEMGHEEILPPNEYIEACFYKAEKLKSKGIFMAFFVNPANADYKLGQSILDDYKAGFEKLLHPDKQFLYDLEYLDKLLSGESQKRLYDMVPFFVEKMRNNIHRYDFNSPEMYREPYQYLYKKIAICKIQVEEVSDIVDWICFFDTVKNQLLNHPLFSDEERRVLGDLSLTSEELSLALKGIREYKNFKDLKLTDIYVDAKNRLRRVLKIYEEFDEYEGNHKDDIIEQLKHKENVFEKILKKVWPKKGRMAVQVLDEDIGHESIGKQKKLLQFLFNIIGGLLIMSLILTVPILIGLVLFYFPNPVFGKVQDYLTLLLLGTGVNPSLNLIYNITDNSFSIKYNLKNKILK